MASGKKRRKAANQARKARRPQVGPLRHPDGDRRHRHTGGMTAEEAHAQKRALQKLGLDMPVSGEEEE
jgi:hypothetical protein